MYREILFNHKYPFLFLLITLVGGILSSQYFTLPAWVFVALVAVSVCISKLSKTQTNIGILIASFCLGNIISHSPSSVDYPSTPILIEARCEQVLPNNNYILSAHNQRFYLSHFHTDTTYQAGDSLTFFATITPFRDNGNPQEFNYALYMRQQDVNYKLRPTTTIQKTNHSHTIHTFFEYQRSFLLEKTNLLTQDTTCATIMNALCLGYKNNLLPELENLFIKTGTIHLLAVSGLHVGIIYLLILFIFKCLHLSTPKSMLFTLPLLWSYALLTGLSPSVVRAALLLSFITIGKILSRTYNPVNILAASAYLTLLVQPSTLYSLSFLLSYSAYSGILLLHPCFLRLPVKLPKIIFIVYSYCCLSIAAQLPTLPISAYYFHTINLNGFLVNLFAVPIATLLLYNSAICFILPVCIGQFLAPISEFLCKILIRTLEFSSPYMLNYQELYPSGGLIVILYLLLLAATGYLIHRNRTFVKASIVTSCMLLVYCICFNLRVSNNEEIVIFHYNSQSALLVNHKGFYLPLKNSADTSTNMRPYILYNKLKPLSTPYGALNEEILWTPPYLHYHGTTILLPDCRQPLQETGEILIITDNLTPEQVFGSSFTHPYPPKVILDGSNNFYNTLQWRDFCDENHLQFRCTAEEGAIQLRRK